MARCLLQTPQQLDPGTEHLMTGRPYAMVIGAPCRPRHRPHPRGLRRRHRAFVLESHPRTRWTRTSMVSTPVDTVAAYSAVWSTRCLSSLAAVEAVPLGGGWSMAANRASDATSDATSDA